MKISASRRDDILRSREEYDMETKRLEELEKKNHSKWNADLFQQAKNIEKRIAETIGSTSLNLSVTVNPWSYYEADSWSVDVKGNEGGNFSDGVALVWNWEAKMDKDGNIIKDSGSWSGLKATTPEQIDNLAESVRILKILNDIDWSEVLNAPKARWEDYIDEELLDNIRNRKKNRPDFESDMQAAQLEELIGGNVAINLKQDQYYRGDVWILPTGLTEKFIKGYIFPKYSAENHKMNADEIREAIGEERRSSRANILTSGGELVTMELN